MRAAVGLVLTTSLLVPLGGVTAPGAGAASSPAACAAIAGSRSPGVARPAATRKTVRYRTIPGVGANANSLDLYSPSGACNAPVVLWVHGGGYHKGDKGGAASATKAALFNRKGWVFASINYRLTEVGDPSSAHYPDHYDDVATAVAWVKSNIKRYGGNPSKVALIGHSAGADIVSNVVDNPAYLKARGLALSSLKCAAPLDTEGFDKVSARDAGGEIRQWQSALGNNPKFLTATSATLIAKRGIGIPRTLGVYRGTARRQKIEKAYLAKLSSLGVRTSTIDARSLTHAQVSTRIGATGDTVMTPPLVSFLTSCFAG